MSGEGDGDEGDGGGVALPRFRGDRLLAAREAAGLSREDLTLALDLSSPFRIRQWELGHERPRPRFVPLLAEALTIAPLQLLDVDPDDPPLAALRIAAGLTTEQLNAPGMSGQSFMRLEDGRLNMPLPDRIELIASALGVDARRVEAAIRRSRTDRT